MKKKLTLEQLKSIAYDLIAQKEDAERKLRIVNNEIASFKEEAKEGEKISELKDEVKEEK